MVWQPSVSPDDVLMHSAKGTTWKKHKYLKKIGNTYVYAKAAAISKRNSKKARKEFEKQYHEGRGDIDPEFNKRIEKRIIDRRNGAPREYFKDSSVYYNQEKAADEFLKSERNARYSRMYAERAKKELSSIPKEMISDGEKTFNRIKNKIKDTLTVKETRTITDLSTGKTRSTNWKPNVKTKRKISIHF